MKLVYYQHQDGNFGDDLNPWLWQRLLPGAWDDNDEILFLGMGTLLGSWFTDRLPPGGRRIVLGTGAGKDRSLPALDRDWRLYGVRGPLTASFLGLERDAVLTDPAMLIGGFPEFTHRARSGIGFMPHYFSLASWDWRATAEALGFVYIDPCAPALETLERIASLETLVTEAMHGAIVADALRIPWIAMSISPAFEGLKWCDWGGSLGMPVFFHHVPCLARKPATRRGRAKEVLRLGLRRAGFRRAGTPRHVSTNWEIEACINRLVELKTRIEPQLSAPSAQALAVERFTQALHRLKTDWT